MILNPISNLLSKNWNWKEKQMKKSLLIILDTFQGKTFFSSPTFLPPDLIYIHSNQNYNAVLKYIGLNLHKMAYLNCIFKSFMATILNSKHHDLIIGCCGFCVLENRFVCKGIWVPHPSISDEHNPLYHVCLALFLWSNCFEMRNIAFWPWKLILKVFFSQHKIRLLLNTLADTSYPAYKLKKDFTKWNFW